MTNERGRRRRPAIEPDDFKEVPFSQYGGLGKACELFGERLTSILDELNERLAA